MFHYPRWSADGVWIVATGHVDGDEEIYLLAADGSSVRKLTDNTIADRDADFLPDGRIVFVREGERGVERLSMDLHGREIRAEPAAPLPRSADGRYEVAERPIDGGQGIYLRDVRAGGERLISTVRWAEQPSFSPDGTSVVWEQRAEPRDILGSDVVVYDITRGTTRRVGQGTDPSWSHDGSLLLFKTPVSGELHITLHELASGTTTRLAPGVHPHFAPDSRRIAYMHLTEARADINIINIDGSQRQCITC